MKILKRVKSASDECHPGQPKCETRLQLTGIPPENPSEQLIKEIIGDSKSVCFDWVEAQVRKNLYLTELKRGGWGMDIGIWGPAVFAKEATRILSGIRPQFARLVREGNTCSAIPEEAEPFSEVNC